MSVRELLTENAGLKALSLLLALLLWLFVTSGMEGEEGITIPVQLRNIPPGLAVESRTPIFVELRIAGPRIFLAWLDKGRLAVNLDLTGVGEGSVTFANLETSVPLRSGLRVTRVYPSIVELKLARKQGLSPGR